jgi:hypothetical protein
MKIVKTDSKTIPYPKIDKWLNKIFPWRQKFLNYLDCLPDPPIFEQHLIMISLAMIQFYWMPKAISWIFTKIFI